MIKPLLLLTMSSSGGKWLASTVARHWPEHRYYDKEYFNPYCNSERELILRRNFGCEMACCYRNIALPGDIDTDKDIDETWEQDHHTFTKEVFSAFKLPTFMKRFKVVALVRRTADTFPPKRSQVWNFYEHTWCALYQAGYALTAATARDRAKEAHAFIRNKIIEDAERHELPLIEFDALQDGKPEEIYDMLGAAFGHVTGDMVLELLATRFRE